MTKAVDIVSQNDIPKIITGYNMAEWSEGSASFQPTVKFGFDYLDAMYDTLRVETNGDFNNDGTIDNDDLTFIVAHWLENNLVADIAPLPNGDGIVDLQDFALFAKYWQSEHNISTYSRVSGW